MGGMCCSQRSSKLKYQFGDSKTGRDETTHFENDHGGGEGLERRSSYITDDIAAHIVQNRYDTHSLLKATEEGWQLVVQALMVILFEKNSKISTTMVTWVRNHVVLHGAPQSCLRHIDSFEAKEWGKEKIRELFSQKVVVKMRYVIVYIFLKMYQAMNIDGSRLLPVLVFEELSVKPETVGRIRDLIDHETFNRKERVALLFPDGRHIKTRISGNPSHGGVLLQQSSQSSEAGQFHMM